MQAGNITTDLKVEIDFTVPELCETKTETWNCHSGYYARGRQEII